MVARPLNEFGRALDRPVYQRSAAAGLPRFRARPRSADDTLTVRSSSPGTGGRSAAGGEDPLKRAGRPLGAPPGPSAEEWNDRLQRLPSQTRRAGRHCEYG